MSKAEDTIRKLSKQAAAQKIAERQAQIEEAVNKDIAIIDKILTMVKDRLIYKEVVLKHTRRTQYLVVTEDVVLQDYSNPAEFNSGTSIQQIGDSWHTYPHTKITVNGHRYYHAADLIAKYKYEANQAMEKAQSERDAAERRKEAIDNLSDLEPVIKELMLNYQKHLGDLEAKE